MLIQMKIVMKSDPMEYRRCQVASLNSLFKTLSLTPVVETKSQTGQINSNGFPWVAERVP